MQFSYSDRGKEKEEEEEEEAQEPRLLVDQPQLPQHPPTTAVDLVGQGNDPYQVPEGLALPDDIATVSAPSRTTSTCTCVIPIYMYMYLYCNTFQLLYFLSYYNEYLELLY